MVFQCENLLFLKFENLDKRKFGLLKIRIALSYKLCKNVTFEPFLTENQKRPRINRSVPIYWVIKGIQLKKYVFTIRKGY